MLLTLLAAAVIAVPPNASEVGVIPPKIIEPTPACPNLRPVLTPVSQASAPNGVKASDNRPWVIAPRVLGAPTAPAFAAPHPLTIEPPAALCSATPAGPPTHYE
jgi:hypothetical protein